MEECHHEGQEHPAPPQLQTCARFEVKRWHASALWSWDIQVETCAICRNHIMDLCLECQANQVNTVPK